MFKILVDGRTHGSYNKDTVCVTVGSAAGADVCLPSAAAEHIKIYPLKDSFGGCYKATVHALDGMTQHTKHWTGRSQTIHWTLDPPYWLAGACATENSVYLHGEKPGWVLVYGGDTLTIRGRNIKVINYCGTCGKEDKNLWQCTCAERGQW